MTSVKNHRTSFINLTMIEPIHKKVQTPKSKPCCAVILAAGLGSRLLPLTINIPKTLVDVNNKPILSYSLSSLEKIGVQKVIFVIGHLGTRIHKYVSDKFPYFDSVFVENKKYDHTGSIESLRLALKEFPENHDLILLEADVLFEPLLLQRFITLGRGHNIATLLEKYNSSLSGSFALINKYGFLSKWVHESVRTRDFPLTQSYKTVNVTWFNSKMVTELENSIEKVISLHNLSAPLEYAMAEILQSRKNIKAVVTQGEKWFEVDTIEDLKIANKIFSDH
jgi:choline kinase